MANGDQVPGGQGGGPRTFSEEDVMALMNEAARRAANEATKNAQKENEDEDETAVSVINPKVVKQLKDTVAVFTALKDLSSNPLQKTIEETVGGMAASVVQSAFAPRGPPPKQDIMDKLLNSQFAFGLGSGLGQRAPELVETMGRTFGSDKTSQMMDSIIGKYGGGGQGNRQLSPGPSSGPSSGPSPGSGSSPVSSPGSSNPTTSEQKTDKQSEKELLLSLDPNNPEHISAYAETQGGLPVDVARKMLMIHQDAFIEQLKRDGMNIDQISTQRGSRAQPGPSQQSPPMQQAPPVQPSQPQPVSPPPMRQDVSPTYPGSHPGSSIDQSSLQSPDDIEYAEYNDITHGNNPGPQPNPQPGHQSVPPGNIDGQQVEMMKTFATDIGKVMGEMLNKIETLNNTVFTLQNEMNDIKRPTQPQSINREMPPRIPSNVQPPITRLSKPVKVPSLETFEDQEIESPKETDIERSEDFFEEDVIDISNFKQELEEEAKLSVQKQQSETVQSVTQPIPPASVPPVSVAQPVPPTIIQPIQPTIALPTPMAQIIKPVQPIVVQPPILEVKQEENIDNTANIDNIDIDNIDNTANIDNIDIDNIENIDTPKIDPKSKDIDINFPIIPIDKTDDKTSEYKDDNKSAMPIKKAGVHKKAEYRNIKPSFKKNDGKENKESNIDREV